MMILIQTIGNVLVLAILGNVHVLVMDSPELGTSYKTRNLSDV